MRLRKHAWNWKWSSTRWKRNSENFDAIITLFIIQLSYYSNQSIIDQKARNQEINDEEIRNQEVDNQETRNHEVNNQDIGSQEVNNQDVGNQEVNNQEIRNQVVTQHTDALHAET